MPSKVKGLVERLKDGEEVLAAEGYLFEFERRGYLQAGPYVPEVVLEHPHLVRAMHEEFAHAGSDVTLAFTYYGHREKLGLIGRGDDLEKMNRNALKIARKVADETGTLMAGNICNSTAYNKDDEKSWDLVKQLFKEQVEWAAEEGADFVVAETISFLGEAKLALEAIKKYGGGIPAVVMMRPFSDKLESQEGVPIADALRELEELGADVVGINCGYGPRTILPMFKQIKEKCKGPLACLPVCYNTNEKEPTFQKLRDPETGKKSFPHELDGWACNRRHIAEFALECRKLGILYIGLCCGNCAHYQRTLAETLGRTTPASRYATDISLHYVYGDLKNNPKLHSHHADMVQNN